MTIWYDFTTTLRNTSRNGIANAEWSIGDELMRVEPGTRCFVLRGNRLVEIERTVLQSSVYAQPHALAPPLTLDSTWRDQIRSGLRHRLGDRSDPVIRLLSVAYLALNTWRARTRSRMRRWLERASARPSIAATVQPGDVVISMGADWSGELASALQRLRAARGCVVVTMVYDLIPLTHTHLAFHKDRSLFERYYDGLISASDLITCISEQSQSDLLAFARARNLAPRATAVLRLGDGRTDSASPAPIAREDFFLWVGTVERRKNLELLYDALRIVDADGGSLPTIVIAGERGWGVTDLLNEIQLQSTPAARAIVMLGAVGDEELDQLYRRARSLLFPSHYEGWGLPVREAAVRGCPVAAGDSPAVREALLGYDSAVLLPVDDPEPWATYMRQPKATTAPAAMRTWCDSANDLRVLIANLDGGGGPVEGPL